MENLDLARLRRKRDLRIILPVFLVSIIACIDRVNIAYAALTMTQDLDWITPEIVADFKPATSPSETSINSVLKPLLSAQRRYMRSNISVQSCASVPPEPACKST